MEDRPRAGLSEKVIDEKPADVVINSQEADADIDYFELKLDEFKNYFMEDFNTNIMKMV